MLRKCLVGQLAFCMCWTSSIVFGEIKAVVFDYCGVLASTGLQKMVPFFEKEFQLSRETVVSFLKNDYKAKRMSLFTDEELWDLWKKTLNVEITKGLQKRCEEFVYKQAGMGEDKIHLIRKLKKNGYKVYLLSNQFPHLKNSLEKLKVFDEFDLSMVSCDFFLKKPSKEFFEKLIDKIEEKPSECIFIDDQKRNLLTAKKLGFHTFQFDLDNDGFCVLENFCQRLLREQLE